MALFSAGDVILKSEPWAYIVRTRYADRACYHCLQSPTGVNLRRCSRCKFVHYCSSQCQEKDWKLRHKPECAVLGEAAAKFIQQFPQRQYLFDDFMIVCQASIKLQRDGTGDFPGACEPPTERTFADLLSHETELAKEPIHKALYSTYKPYFDRIPEVRAACPDFATYLSIVGKFLINVFTVMNPEQGLIGKGLYLGPSVIDHSCIPTACYGYVGKTIKIKAMADICRLEDVRINYTKTFAVPEVRQAALMKTYYFRCNCRACTDPDLNRFRELVVAVALFRHLLVQFSHCKKILTQDKFPRVDFVVNISMKKLAVRHSVKCSSKTCTAAIPLDDTSDSKCFKCGWNNDQQIAKGKGLVEPLLKEQKMLKDMEDDLSDYDKLKLLITTASNAEKVFHPSNFLLGIVYQQLSNVFSSTGKVDKAGEYMNKALVAMKAHMNNYDTEYTNSLAFVGDWMMRTGNIVDAGPVIEEIHRIDAVMVDPEHQNFRL